MSVDPDLYRSAMSRLATGVTVISTCGVDRPELMTANAITSVSLRPPLLLVGVGHQAHWLAAARDCGRFAVNVLGRGHERLARWCADQSRHDAPEQAHRFDVRVSSTGLVTVEGALAVLECRVYDEHPAGDHTLVIGEVDRVHERAAETPPLVFFDREFTTTSGRRLTLPGAAAS